VQLQRCRPCRPAGGPTVVVAIRFAAMSNVRRWIAIAVAVYLLLVLLDRFVLVELFFRRAGVALGAALFESFALIACGFALRGLLLRRWRFEELDVARDFLIGYPVFGTLCFLVGLLNISAPSMLALLVAAGVAGLYAVVRRFESRPVKIAALPAVPVAAAAVIVAGLVLAQAPPTSLDELAYHLAVPWTWVKEGRAIALPLLSHSYFPLGVESADLPLLAIFGTVGGGIASHLLHLCAAVAAAAVAYEVTKRNALATAAIITTPALAITAGWSLVDWPLGGLCLTAFTALEEDDDARLAAALGAGLLTKYTFIPFALVMILGARRWRLRVVLPALAIGSVFFLRNLILTANPFAPFFSAAAPHVAHYRAAPYLSDYVFDGQFIDESLGASLLALLPLTAGLVPVALAVVAAILFFLAPSARILVPLLVVPAAVAGRALDRSRVVRILLVVAVAVQLFLVAYFGDRSAAFALLGGRQSDEEYLIAARPSYAAVEAADALLPSDARALVVGLNETYWFEHRVRGGGNFDGPRMSAYLDEPTPDALYAKLKRDGVTHVAVINLPAPTNVEKKVEERGTKLGPLAQRLLSQTLDRYAVNIASRGAATVFTLK
jgi:hypothetical protein